MISPNWCNNKIFNESLSDCIRKNITNKIKTNICIFIIIIFRFLHQQKQLQHHMESGSNLHIHINAMADFSVKFSITLEGLIGNNFTKNVNNNTSWSKVIYAKNHQIWYFSTTIRFWLIFAISNFGAILPQK